MIDEDPIRTDGRRRRKQKRLSSSHPVCVLCSCSDIEALTAVTPEWLKERGVIIPPGLLEMHHVVGEKHDSDFVVALCLNCHRRVTEALDQGQITMQPKRDSRELVALMLDALAIFLDMLVAAIRRWAEVLRQSLMQESTND